VQIDKGRGAKVGFVRPIWEKGECISNVWGTKVIFLELANFSFI